CGRRVLQVPRDPSGSGPADLLADVPAGSLGRGRGADFFTTEVWTPQGLITYYMLFVIDLQSRRVHVAGSTPTPDGWFMAQAARRMTVAGDGVLAKHRGGTWARAARGGG